MQSDDLLAQAVYVIKGTQPETYSSDSSSTASAYQTLVRIAAPPAHLLKLQAAPKAASNFQWVFHHFLMSFHTDPAPPLPDAPPPPAATFPPLLPAP
ncbi:hypothetical protein M422DRAFT_248704 [Sphaerobolus stellatus SS14]|nr:hypothetical protein M422DRAFT_248704 [Sphaerobolus stellatus SS14]